MERERPVRVRPEFVRRQQSTRGYNREGDKDVEHTNTAEWQVVRRKKVVRNSRRTDVARSYLYFPKDAQRTNYFFTNFPENFMQNIC